MKQKKITILHHAEPSVFSVVNNYRIRGSALIMAIVATTLLFIIGSLFLLSSRTYRQTTSSIDTVTTEQAAIDAVVDRIDTVLVEDLFGTGGASGMLDETNQNEYWDYPYSNPTPGYLGFHDDYWLASLEPDLMMLSGSPFYYWRHITDLWRNNFGVPYINSTPGAAYFDVNGNSKANFSSTPYYYSYWNYVCNADDGTLCPLAYQFKPTLATIVNDTISINTHLESSYQGKGYYWPDTWPWGGLADADGDGVSDARWAKVPDVTSPDGKNVYTAVRIVDNCAMININTAFRDLDVLPLVPPENWDGSRLTDVNLRTITKEGNNVSNVTSAEKDVAIAKLYDVRSGGDGSAATLLTPNEYQVYVASRVLNPNDPCAFSITGHATSLFDLSDELELRNRDFLNTNMLTRSKNCWFKTFQPGGLYSNYQPYTDPTRLPDWFERLSQPYNLAGLDNPTYARRHIVTAYNASRVIVPQHYSAAAGTWPPTNMPTELQQAWQQWTNWNNNPPLNWTYRPVCVTDIAASPTTPIEGIIGNRPNIDLLAAAIWLGLPDMPFAPPAFGFFAVTPGYSSAWNTLTRTDLACQMAVNMVDYIDQAAIGSSEQSTSIRITTTAPDTKTYYGYEANGDNLYITEIAKGKYRDGSGNLEEDYYAIEIYNPAPIGSAPVSLLNWTLEIEDPSNSIPLTTHGPVSPQSTVIITGEDIGCATSANTVFGIGTGIDVGLIFDDDTKITLVDPSGRPSDSIFSGSPSMSPPSTNSTANTYSLERGNLFLDNLVPVWDVSTSWSAGNNLGSFTPSDGAGVGSGISAQTVISSRDNMTLPTIGEIDRVLGIGASHEAAATDSKYKSLPEWFGGYLTGGNLGSMTDGRMEVAHPDFTNIFKFLVVQDFNPFSDGVDNDHRNGADPTDKQELAVAGRININTAPWYVLAQLPWVTWPYASTPFIAADRFKLAQAIVAYRDKQNLEMYYGIGNAPNYAAGRARATRITTTPALSETPGFTDISELLNVTETVSAMISPLPAFDIRWWGRNEDPSSLGTPYNDNPTTGTVAGPLYNLDDATNDLEERNIIFDRISNLATVRSDTFTAYIAVRVGEAGPVKRMIAIFDRSNVFAPTDKPELVALQPVPDPN